MSTTTDEVLGTRNGSGVVESDLADDTEPDYAGMSDDERETAVAELLATGQVTETQARERVYGVGASPEAESAPPKPMQIPIPGTIQGISTEPGGSAPTVSEARMLGGSLPIEGEFEGEEFVQLLVTAKVGEVAFVYTTDDWGNTTVVKRRHKMRMISVRRAE